MHKTCQTAPHIQKTARIDSAPEPRAAAEKKRRVPCALRNPARYGHRNRPGVNYSSRCCVAVTSGCQAVGGSWGQSINGPTPERAAGDPAGHAHRLALSVLRAERGRSLAWSMVVTNEQLMLTDLGSLDIEQVYRSRCTHRPGCGI